MMNLKVTVIFFVVLIPQTSSSIHCDVKDERRFILIGKTGVGKSTTGNSILGKNVFHTGLSAKSLTKTCQLGKAKKGNTNLLLVDTPGFGDTEEGIDQTRIIIEIAQGFTFMSPGPHGILFVLGPDKVRKEDEAHLKQYHDVFGYGINKYTITIFTKITDDGEVKNYINTFNEGSVLSKLMQDSSYRYVIFGDPKNKTRRALDVKMLQEKIEEMMERNNPKCFLTHISNLTEKLHHHLGNGDRDKSREKIKEAFQWLISVSSHVAMTLTLSYYLGFPFASITIIEWILHIILYFF